MGRGICAAVTAALAALALLAACGHPPPPRPPPVVKPPSAHARSAPPPPPDWYWEPVEAIVRPPARPPLELPLAGELSRVGGAARIWDELAPDARDRLRQSGLVVVPNDGGPRSMSAFYTALRDQRVPHLLTLDALFVLVHTAMTYALAEAEQTDLAPQLASFLDKLDARLAREDTSTDGDISLAYRTARGLVAVGRALSATTPYVAPLGLIPVVEAERTRIEAHARIAPSPLLGAPIDYAQFAAPKNAARPAAFRTLTWLATAPLLLVGQGEERGALVDVGRARTNARAAMVLARACDRDVDPDLFAAYTHVLRLAAFVWGHPDDLPLTELDEIATDVSVDITKPADIANVVRVDKVRRRARAGRTPIAYDGAGTVGRGGLAVRLFGGHGSLDSVALEGFAMSRGSGAIPSTLDVAVWLGAPEARAAVDDIGKGASTYDDAAAALGQTRPPVDGGALHASVHGSLLDALLAWASAPRFGATARGPASARARVESLLAAWTLMRDAGQPFTRPKLEPASAAGAPTTELRVSGAALPIPVFVEPLPDTVARLMATVRQLRRGLDALVPLAPDSKARSMLVEVEDLLRVALRAAERQAANEPSAAEDAATLASVPARMARVEEAAEGVRPATAPIEVIAYTDPKTHRLLISATGLIETMITVAREPGKDEPLLVVGAHLVHDEYVATTAGPSGARTAEPSRRGAWVGPFRWSKATPSP